MKILLTAFVLLMTVICHSQVATEKTNYAIVDKPKEDSIYIKSMETVFQRFRVFIYDKYTGKDIDILTQEMQKILQEAINDWLKRDQYNDASTKPKTEGK